MSQTLPSADGASSRPSTRSPGGLAPSKRMVNVVKDRRNVAFIIWAVPLGLVLIGLYVRLAAITGPLHLGILTWVWPAAAVTLLAAIQWVLIVHPHSRGNTLGDHLRIRQEKDAESSQIDNDLRAAGRQKIAEGREAGEVGKAALLESTEVVNDWLHIAPQAMRIACNVFQVPEIGKIRESNLSRPSMPHYGRIAIRLQREQVQLDELAKGIDTPAMPAIAPTGSPHAIYANPAHKPPDPAFIDPATLHDYPSSTLGAYVPIGNDEQPIRSRNWLPWIVAAIAVMLLIIGSIWLASGHGAAASTGAIPPVGTMPSPRMSSPSATTATSLVPAHPAPPAGLRVGVDYSFLDRAKDGALARWSCTKPITVRLAGPAPRGAQATLSQAVAALRSASHLPLQVGTPLPKVVASPSQVPPGEITYSYLTPAEIRHAHIDLKGDVLGEGGPSFDSSTGRITSGWVAIRANDPDVAPTTLIGKETVWHEGAHALNLGHAKQNSGKHEIMTPSTDGSGPLAWGPGDRYALAAIGCTTS